MLSSIRWRLVISYMLLALLVVSSVGLLALLAVQRYARQQEAASLTANAEAVAQQAATLMWPSLAPGELRRLSQTASFFGSVRVRIYDNQERILADSGGPGEGGQAWLFILSKLPGFRVEDWILGVAPSGGVVEREALFSMLEALPPGTGITAIQRDSGPWGARFTFEDIRSVDELRALGSAEAETTRSRSEVTVSVPVVISGGRLLGRVELSSGTDFGAEALATTRRGLLLAGAGAVVLAGIAGLMMGNRLSAPLTELTGTAGLMSAGDLTVRARVESRDEIGRLAAQFNQMAGQLQSSFIRMESERDTLRRFIADASHELRTPITALRNFNELLQGAAAEDPEAREEFLRESQVQIERLAWITQNLLDLSRLEAGLAGLDLEKHDLGEIVQSVAASFRRTAQEKQINLEVHTAGEPAAVASDRARVEILLSNLLDNALKFTPPGGRVEIGFDNNLQGWRLWVQDSGPGIPPGDFDHIFERFYRGENQRETGSGLGLSIVQSILTAHGWEIQVENTEPTGALFIISPGEDRSQS